jgi:Fic family protein
MNDLDKFVKETTDPDVTGCFTIEEYATKTGMSLAAARGVIDRAVDKGSLVELKSRRDGRMKNYYRLKTE